MRRLQPVIWGLMGSVIGVAATVGAAPQEDRSWIMPVSEIRPGMTGYGLTVFRGETPERFKVEILGVLHNGVGAGVDMILARLEHEALRDLGVIAGMSGSPVFLNNRMIGAVAYSPDTFSKTAIAGITPIEKMLEVYDRTPLEPPPRDVALGPAETIRYGEPVSFEPKMQLFGPEPVRIQWDNLPASARALFAGEPNARAADEIRLKPLALPVMVSNCSPQTARLVERLFKPLGMETVFAPAGGSSGASADLVSTVPLVNGTAVGIPYVMGDLNARVGGTVTYTDGKKVVIFGHSMLARGPIEFPMGPARVITTYPSAMRPFKMMELAGLSGSVYQDRLAAVGGIVGKIPYMVPMTVKVIHEGNKTDRTYRYWLTDSRLFTPRMATLALVESCSSGERAEGDLTATVHYRLETDDGRVIEKEDMASGSMAPMTASLNLLSDMAPIYSNEFQVRSVRKVAAEVRLRDGIQAASLHSAFVDRSIVRPGETISISTYVKPWRKEMERLTTTLTVPADLPNGRYNVAVCDSRQREGAEAVRAPGLYRPQNFADVVRILDIQFPANRLYVILTNAEGGVTIDGREFDTLPPSFQHTLSQLRDREKIVPTIGQILAEATVNLPYVLSGSQITQIEVDRRGGR